MILGGLSTRQSFHVAELRIGARQKRAGAYPASLSVLGWRDFAPVAFLPDLKALQDKETDPEGYGIALGEMLFQPTALGAAIRETMAVMDSRDENLHIRLAVEPPELQSLRWELLHRPEDSAWKPLSSSADTPFCRRVAPGSWARPDPLRDRPLKMLAVIASPSNLGTTFQLDPVDPAERLALHAALDALKEIQVEYLESETHHPPTLENLRRLLAEGIHLVHFLCHGAVTPGGTVLFLEQAGGGADPVTTRRLAGALRAPDHPPAFVFLSACESAKRSRQDGFAPMGPALVEKGAIQAVVAMSDKVGQNTAQTLATQFYRRLLIHGLVDQAMNEARQLIQERWDWGVPVLFSRLDDNQLVDFPVAGFYDQTLAYSDRAYAALRTAKGMAQAQQAGLSAAHEIDALIVELSKSHKLLADLGKDFRNTGYDLQTFAQNFTHFRNDVFKPMYEGQTWAAEESSCHRIQELGTEILQSIGPFLDKPLLAELEADIRVLGNQDNDLMRLFGDFLVQMNVVVDAIWAQIVRGDAAGAIQKKLEFEAQISPILRRNLDTFNHMSSAVGRVSKA